MISLFQLRHINETYLLAVLFGIAIYSTKLSAQVIVAPQSADQVFVTVSESVAYSENTHLYEYNYTIISDPSSAQNIWYIAMNVKEEAVSGAAPPGWTFFYDPRSGVASWAATDFPDDFPEPVDYSSLPESPYQLQPGSSLSGFGFKSVGGPTAEILYVQGFVPLPIANSEDDFEDEGYVFKSFEEDSFSVSTLGPMASDVYSGNRRPAVDGFLGFVNLNSGGLFAAPISIGLEFSLSGELVSSDTFYASLNGTDVTEYFQPNSSFPGDLSATFDLTEDSPLLRGKNVLITGIEGMVPGTTRSAGDTDRVTFTIQ